MPGIWYEVGLSSAAASAAAPRSQACRASPWARTTTSPSTFTNVMADVEDLFVERIEDDSYEFEGERRPLEIIEERDRRAWAGPAERHEVRLTHHGPIVNQALGADDEQPLALRWAALDEPAISTRMLGRARASQRAGAGASCCATVTMPRLEPGLGRPARIDRLQDDRPHPDAQGRLPRPAEAGLDAASSSGRAGSPTTSCPSWSIPTRATSSPPTTGSSTTRIRTTSPATGSDGYPRGADRAAARRARAARPRATSAACRPTSIRSPATRWPTASPAWSRHSQREVQGDRAAEELGPHARAADRSRGRSTRPSCLRLARSSPARRSATATSPSAISIAPTTASLAHVTSPWRWHAHLLELWDEGDDELIGGSWDEARARGAARARWTTSRSASGPIPKDGDGAVCTRSSSHTRSGRPSDRGMGLQPHASIRAARRRRSAQIAYDPNRSLPRDLGAELADGRRPVGAGALAAGRRSPASPGTPGAATTTTCSRAGRRARCSRWPARGRFETLVLTRRRRASPSTRLMPSRRDQIKLTDEEQRELIESERIVVVSRSGRAAGRT